LRARPCATRDNHRSPGAHKAREDATRHVWTPYAGANRIRFGGCYLSRTLTGGAGTPVMWWIR
jgi:hypothetical protein